MVKKPQMKNIYVIAWLAIALFLGWSGNLLLMIQSHWTETNRLHRLHDDIENLAMALGDISRPGNDVLENYEVARNRAAFDDYTQRYLTARDVVLGRIRDDKELEPLFQGLDRAQATLSGLAREILGLAGERERLRQAGAAQDLVRAKETEAAASMARMDQAFQAGLDILLRVSGRLVDREQRVEIQQQRNFKLLYVMLLGALVASALSVELLRRTIRQREALRQAAVVFENIAEGIVVTDAQGTIQSVNPAFTRITLYPGEEVIGRNPRILQSGRHDREFYTAMWTSLRVSGRWQGEIWNRRSNGDIYPQWLNISAIQDDRGRTTNYLGVTWDITELKASERNKEAFIAAVSHELRTPLTSVLASLGLLMQGDGGPMPERAQTLVRMAYSNSGRLVRLMGDILDIEKMAAGEMRFEFKALELMPLVEQTIESSMGLLEQLASGISIVLVESLPGVRVTGDAERLMQALANLLSNAAKFSPPDDRVEIAVCRLGTMVRIAVTDHGPGIPEEFRPQVFKKFAQAGMSNLQHKGGIGLGLSIARDIVGKHGGRIDYESLPGVRTTFFIELPELLPEHPGSSGAAPVS